MEKLTNTETYICAGRIRGWCGHHHLSLDAAKACLAKDMRGCNKQGGYSDRYVYRIAPGVSVSAILDGILRGNPDIEAIVYLE